MGKWCGLGEPMKEPIAFLNGRFLPQSQAGLALNDAGFVLGATVTDLCRTFRHRLYRWVDHLARFRAGCLSAYIELGLSNEEISALAEEVVAQNAALIAENDDLALVIFATPGPLGYYLGQPSNGPATLGLHTFPLPVARYRHWIEQGVLLATPKVQAVPAACIDPHIKHRSRMHWWLAQEEIRQQDPVAHALLLDADGCVTETASSNFLIVKDGHVVSPPRGRILGGVSLQVVAELCERLGVPIEFRKVTLDDCFAADEALLTCTSYCLAGVRRINDRDISWPGPMLKRLSDAWNAEVGIDIHAQITSRSST